MNVKIKSLKKKYTHKRNRSDLVYALRMNDSRISKTKLPVTSSVTHLGQQKLTPLNISSVHSKDEELHISLLDTLVQSSSWKAKLEIIESTWERAIRYSSYHKTLTELKDQLIMMVSEPSSILSFDISELRKEHNNLRVKLNKEKDYSHTLEGKNKALSVENIKLLNMYEEAKIQLEQWLQLSLTTSNGKSTVTSLQELIKEIRKKDKTIEDLNNKVDEFKENEIKLMNIIQKYNAQEFQRYKEPLFKEESADGEPGVPNPFAHKAFDITDDDLLSLSSSDSQLVIDMNKETSYSVPKLATSEVKKGEPFIDEFERHIKPNFGL